MAIGSEKPPVLLIAGPTASSKSALALAVAEQIRGVIVNADSAQVYRGLEVLSAAPTAADRARADHRLYGMFDPSRACSAADWAVLARAEIDSVHAEGKVPVLVGGTGLYLRTLLEGIAPVPPIDPAIRAEVRARSVEQNRVLLEAADPGAAARLAPADSTRVARALEVVMSTGRPLADWQSRREGGIGERISLRPLLLLPPRADLYARCDARFAAMFDGGAVEEVKSLLAQRLDGNFPAMRAIGVREIAEFVLGSMSRDEAVAAGQQATRRYAKRQYTWFAHQSPATWPRYERPVDRAMGDALALITPMA